MPKAYPFADIKTRIYPHVRNNALDFVLAVTYFGDGKDGRKYNDVIASNPGSADAAFAETVALIKAGRSVRVHAASPLTCAEMLLDILAQINLDQRDENARLTLSAATRGH